MDRRASERRTNILPPGHGDPVSPLEGAVVESRVEDRRTGLRPRRRFRVPGPYELRAILGVSGLFAVVLAILDVALYRLQQARSEKALQVAPELSRLIVGQDRMEMGLIVLASAVGLLAVVLIVMFESNHTARPLENLKRTMQKFVEQGGGLRARFRREDHFHDVAHAFNALAASVERQAQENAARAALAAAALRRIVHEAGDASRSSGLAERLGRVADELDQIAQGRAAHPDTEAAIAEGRALAPRNPARAPARSTPPSTPPVAECKSGTRIRIRADLTASVILTLNALSASSSTTSLLSPRIVPLHHTSAFGDEGTRIPPRPLWASPGLDRGGARRRHHPRNAVSVGRSKHQEPTEQRVGPRSTGRAQGARR
jgi:hypothetical protein